MSTSVFTLRRRWAPSNPGRSSHRRSGHRAIGKRVCFCETRIRPFGTRRDSHALPGLRLAL